MDGIIFKDVSFSYKDESIISNLSVTVPENSFTLVVGPNGAGKTTWLRLAAGLLTPVSGSVTIDGLSVKSAQKQGIVHIVPQLYNKNAAQFPASVEEIVGFGLAVGKAMSKKDRKERVAEALSLVGMTDKRKSRVGDLSGGQQQRVMLAQALARRPKYLLLDEPTSGIDVVTSASIFGLLQDFAKQGVTIVMVTHDVEEAAKVADRVLCISKDVCYYGDAQGFIDSHSNSQMAWHVGG